jgi:signal transduction histidine kinase
MDTVDRLSWLCDHFRLQSGIDCRLDVRVAHTRLDPMALDVLYRAIRELLVLHKRAQTREILVASELRADGSVAFHVRDVGSDASGGRTPALELDSLALWDVDQRLREVGAYLEVTGELGLCASVVFPGQLVIAR